MASASRAACRGPGASPAGALSRCAVACEEANRLIESSRATGKTPWGGKHDRGTLLRRLRDAADDLPVLLLSARAEAVEPHVRRAHLLGGEAEVVDKAHGPEANVVEGR